MSFHGPVDMKARGYQMVFGAVDIGLFRKASVMSLTQGSDEEVGDGKDADEKYWSGLNRTRVDLFLQQQFFVSV
ncbi:unnamed protein product [Linum trigynum]|uniref:Uncharacterized protein n=1 Tax=Linum trigynum TaxID=586398 RepID=A0AAV2E777_9ROSI